MNRYFAISAKGIESVTASELTRLGAKEVKAIPGGVHFEGDLELLYRANLWLRTASRVLMPLKEFSAKTPQMLYDQVRRLKWEQLLNPDMTFAVDCTLSGQKIEGMNHSKYVALKIKDAIVDQLRMKQGARPNVDTERPDIKVVAHVSNGRCTLSLDSSGASLHERGYRVSGAKAPLKETLAAAIIELSGWNPETPFIDPMCGSGTLVLEAALKARNVAPGLFRDRFGFFGWPDFDEKLWQELVEDAMSKKLDRAPQPIVGSDRDRYAIATALDNAKRAGLTRTVHFERRELNALEPVGEKPGTLIVNPPYGERLGEVEELKGLYEQLGDLFKQRMKGYTAFIFTGNLELSKSVGLRASRRIELFNGPIECRLLRYDMY